MFSNKITKFKTDKKTARKRKFSGCFAYIVDSKGNPVVSYSYDAWGNFATKFFFKYGLADAKNPYTVTLGDTTYTAQDIDNLNGFYYRGYYLDKETNLYYLTTRYYDPNVGRFISPDDSQYLDFESPYGHNVYAYCGNNPVMGVDPEGTWNWDVFFRITAVAAVVVASVAVSVATCGLGVTVGGLALGAGIGLVSEFTEDITDDGVINKDFVEYVGATVGGAISGLGGNTLLFNSLTNGAGSFIDAIITGKTLQESLISFGTNTVASFVAGGCSRIVGGMKMSKLKSGKYSAKKTFLKKISSQDSAISKLFEKFTPAINKEQTLWNYVVSQTNLSKLMIATKLASGTAGKIIEFSVDKMINTIFNYFT